MIVEPHDRCDGGVRGPQVTAQADRPGSLQDSRPVDGGQLPTRRLDVTRRPGTHPDGRQISPDHLGTYGDHLVRSMHEAADLQGAAHGDLVVVDESPSMQVDGAIRRELDLWPVRRAAIDETNDQEREAARALARPDSLDRELHVDVALLDLHEERTACVPGVGQGDGTHAVVHREVGGPPEHPIRTPDIGRTPAVGLVAFEGVSRDHVRGDRWQRGRSRFRCDRTPVRGDRLE